MRRLDSLECERAMEELRLLVEEGLLTNAQARPAVQALFRRGMSDEAATLFDESCRSRARTITITVVEADEQDLPVFGFELNDPKE